MKEAEKDAYEELYQNGYKGAPCPVCGNEMAPVHFFIATADGEPAMFGFDGATATPFLAARFPAAGFYKIIEVPPESFCSSKCLAAFLIQKVSDLETAIEQETQPFNE